MILLFLSVLLVSTNAAHVISIYGDVHKDVEFFTRTFPWVIDNIGGELIVEYNLLGSGRYSVPQMCALEDLKLNTFLQAQYLKCEAEGKPSGYCLCEAGIDPQKFKQCVASGGLLASLASAKYTELGINLTPVIELEPNNTVYGTEDIWFLKKVCAIFGNNLPRGCVDYSNSKGFPDKKAYAQFDRACDKEFPISDDVEKPATTTEWSTWETTTTTENIRTSQPPPPSQWWKGKEANSDLNQNQGADERALPKFTVPWPITPTECPSASPWSTTPQPWSTTSPPWSTTPPPWSTTSTPTPGCNTAPDWWSTTPPPWSTTSPPWSTTPPPWSTTPPPWWSTTPPPWSTTPPPWWSTTPPPWSTTPPPWSTTSPPWSTTPPPWSTTSTPTPGCNTAPDWWYTTPPPWSTTPPPWWSTTAPPEWFTTSTPSPTTTQGCTTGQEWWSTTAPPEWFTTSTPLPTTTQGCTTGQEWWSTTSPPWSTTPPPWWATRAPPEWFTTWHHWKVKSDSKQIIENDEKALPENENNANDEEALPKFSVPWPITRPPWPITRPTNTPWTGPDLPYSTTEYWPPWPPWPEWKAKLNSNKNKGNAWHEWKANLDLKQNKENEKDAIPKLTAPWPITTPWPITNTPWTGPPLPYETTPTFPWPWLLKQKGNDENKISKPVAPEEKSEILAE